MGFGRQYGSPCPRQQRSPVGSLWSGPPRLPGRVRDQERASQAGSVERAGHPKSAARCAVPPWRPPHRGGRPLAPRPPFGCSNHDLLQKPSPRRTAAEGRQLRGDARAVACWALRGSAPHSFPRSDLCWSDWACAAAKAPLGPPEPPADLIPQASERGPRFISAGLQKVEPRGETQIHRLPQRTGLSSDGPKQYKCLWKPLRTSVHCSLQWE